MTSTIGKTIGMNASVGSKSTPEIIPKDSSTPTITKPKSTEGMTMQQRNGR